MCRQVHFPFPFFSQELLASAMTQLYQEGVIKAVGVCNYNVDQTRTLHALLAKQGIPLASNQVCRLRSLSAHQLGRTLSEVWKMTKM